MVSSRLSSRHAGHTSAKELVSTLLRALAVAWQIKDLMRTLRAELPPHQPWLFPGQILAKTACLFVSPSGDQGGLSVSALHLPRWRG
mmetsp:Transcript_34584/g.63212  ORF Transcript_34584/g.63212 Transcript_34584/m.63212 type:complete len:87 (-) Transcript_34584:832-1092(-)